jgi:hypothetical protein
LYFRSRLRSFLETSTPVISALSRAIQEKKSSSRKLTMRCPWKNSPFKMLDISSLEGIELLSVSRAQAINLASVAR